VRCLHAHAHVVDVATELRRARAQARRGDAEWHRRLVGYQRGEALIVGLTASAMIDSKSGFAELRCFLHEAIWIDLPITRGVLTERLVGLARRAFQPVGARLRDRGVQLADREDAIAVILVIDSLTAEPLDSTDRPSSAAAPAGVRPRLRPRADVSSRGTATDRGELCPVIR